MARMRRRGGFRRRRKPQTDWVVTPDGWNLSEHALANAQVDAYPLVWAPNALLTGIGNVDADEPYLYSDGLQFATRGYAVPNMGITTLAVRGRTYIRADASWWTTSALTDISMRIDVLEYVAETMQATVPSGYSLNGRTWADDGWLWDFRLRRVDTQNGGYFEVEHNLRVKRRMPENRTLYLIVENNSGSGHTLQILNRIRTLCKFDTKGAQRK